MQPKFEDIMVYAVHFGQPHPFDGWVVIRNFHVIYTDAKQGHVLMLACGLARSNGVRCFRELHNTIEQVDCDIA
jgi:hypothetical protein